MNSRNLERIIVYGLIGLFVAFGLYLQRPNETPGTDGPEIAFLDVGQGDAILLTNKNRQHVLIDGGPDKKVLESLSAELLPTERRIDTVVLTHPHADHVVGLNYVLERYDVGEIYISGAVHPVPEYLQFLELIKSKNIPAHKAFQGTTFTLGDLDFEVLYPESDLTGVRPADQNDGSVVVGVGAAGGRALLLGDLSAKLQDKYLTAERLGGHYNLIKISHHGSKTGTSQKILDIIKPDYAVITVGKDNSYGLPASKILFMLATIKTFRTDRDGTIRFRFTENGVTLR